MSQLGPRISIEARWDARLWDACKGFTQIPNFLFQARLDLSIPPGTLLLLAALHGHLLNRKGEELIAEVGQRRLMRVLGITDRRNLQKLVDSAVSLGVLAVLPVGPGKRGRYDLRPLQEKLLALLTAGATDEACA